MTEAGFVGGTVLALLVGGIVWANIHAREVEREEKERDKYLTPEQRAEKEWEELDRRQW